MVNPTAVVLACLLYDTREYKSLGHIYEKIIVNSSPIPLPKKHAYTAWEALCENSQIEEVDRLWLNEFVKLATDHFLSAQTNKLIKGGYNGDHTVSSTETMVSFILPVYGRLYIESCQYLANALTCIFGTNLGYVLIYKNELGNVGNIKNIGKPIFDKVLASKRYKDFKNYYSTSDYKEKRAYTSDVNTDDNNSSSQSYSSEDSQLSKKGFDQHLQPTAVVVPEPPSVSNNIEIPNNREDFMHSLINFLDNNQTTIKKPECVPQECVPQECESIDTSIHYLEKLRPSKRRIARINRSGPTKGHYTKMLNLLTNVQSSLDILKKHISQFESSY